MWILISESTPSLTGLQNSLPRIRTGYIDYVPPINIVTDTFSFFCLEYLTFLRILSGWAKLFNLGLVNLVEMKRCLNFVFNVIVFKNPSKTVRQRTTAWYLNRLEFYCFYKNYFSYVEHHRYVHLSLHYKKSVKNNYYTDRSQTSSTMDPINCSWSSATSRAS